MLFNALCRFQHLRDCVIIVYNIFSLLLLRHSKIVPYSANRPMVSIAVMSFILLQYNESQFHVSHVAEQPRDTVRSAFE